MKELIVMLLTLSMAGCASQVTSKETVAVQYGEAEHATYSCKVEKKFDTENVYTPAMIKKWLYSVQIEEKGDTAFLSRCSFSTSANKVTCDRYRVDKIAYDNHVNIKKYYHFSSHFDVQLYSDLSFIENNGRGGIAFGKCNITSP